LDCNATNTTDTVYRNLKKKILSKSLLPGSKLPSERTLAETYGVSRVTVRDAVRNLTVLGLLKKIPSSGTYVRKFESEASLDLLVHIMQSEESVDAATLWSLLEFRRASEVLAARLAARNGTPKSAEPLLCILSDIKAHPKDPDYLAEADFRLHFAIADLSGNIVLRLMFNSFKPVYHFCARRFYALDGAPAESVNLHEKLVQAIVAKDEEFCAHVMEKTLLYAENRLKEAMACCKDDSGKIRLTSGFATRLSRCDKCEM